jgi:tetratricopeptide (TPR) repeat protein
MALTGDQYQRLQAALRESFSEFAELRRVVRFGLNTDLVDIVSENNGLDDVIFRLIDWTEAQGHTLALVRAVCADRGDNPAMKAIAAELGVECRPQVQVQARVQRIAPWQWAAIAGALLLGGLIMALGLAAAMGPPDTRPTPTAITNPTSIVIPTVAVPTVTALPTATGAAGITCGSADDCMQRGLTARGQAEKAPPDAQPPLWRQVVVYFNRAVAQDPNFAEAYNQLAYAYDRTGQYDQAVAAYGRAIDLTPKKGIYYYGRGSSYYRWGSSEATKFLSAVADLKIAVSLDDDPNFHFKAYAYRFMGSAYLGLHDSAQAAAALHQAEALCTDPSYQCDAFGLSTEIANDLARLATPTPGP